jgi:hypothetical protein
MTPSTEEITSSTEKRMPRPRKWRRDRDNVRRDRENDAEYREMCAKYR